jgi:hypothetical protein
VRSHNHCCSAKYKIITYSECVLLALVIQHDVIRGTCDHGMACHQVEDGGTASIMEGQWNILKKQSRTTDKFGHSSWGWARSSQILKKLIILRTVQKDVGP